MRTIIPSGYSVADRSRIFGPMVPKEPVTKLRNGREYRVLETPKLSEAELAPLRLKRISEQKRYKQAKKSIAKAQRMATEAKRRSAAHNKSKK